MAGPKKVVSGGLPMKCAALGCFASARPSNMRGLCAACWEKECQLTDLAIARATEMLRRDGEPLLGYATSLAAAGAG